MVDIVRYCDACVQRARVAVLLSSGQEIAYCAHHATRWWDRLDAIAFHIDDRRSQSRCGCASHRHQERHEPEY